MIVHCVKETCGMMADSRDLCALVSGGKDSIYTIFKCRQLGFHVAALASLTPPPSSLTISYSSFFLIFS